MNSNESIALAQVFALFAFGIGVGAAGVQLRGTPRSPFLLPVALTCASGGLLTASQMLHLGIRPIIVALAVTVSCATWMFTISIRRPNRQAHANSERVV